MSKDSEEMHAMLLSHAHQICGIVAHVKDRGVASVAIRSLAIAGECLVDRREQEEVLEIFDKIRKETGWNVKFLHAELKAKWGWQEDGQQQSHQQNSLAQFFPSTTQPPTSSLPPAPPPPPRFKGAGGINPLLKSADFSNPNHPYQQFYQPPNPHQHNQYNYM
jgi:hypothetical protein